VNGYPTLKVFRNGVPTDYSGPRKADGIVSYMIKQSLPAITDVTLDSHDQFIKDDKVVLVAYGDASHPVPQAYLDYANTARDTYLFGQMASGSHPSIPDSPSLPAIVLYKQFDEGHTVLPASEVASLTAESLGAFVKLNSVPLMDEISPENFASYAEQGLPIAYLFVEPEKIDVLQQFVEDLTPLARELKGKVNFVYIDAVKFVDHGKSLNLPGDAWPAFVIQDLAAQTKYPLTGVADKRSVESFVRKWVAGDVKPSIKSQEIPTEQGPVFKLTADGWNQLFDDESKDIFAEFYAPWCGHCQRLAPIWESLGEKYTATNSVVIAQMDATENDIPPQAPFKVSGFPTLKFRPAGSSEFVDYNGDRSLESLIEFIEANRASSGGEELGKREVEEEAEVEEEEDDAPEHDEL